jgi:hypothetical protein
LKRVGIRPVIKIRKKIASNGSSVEVLIFWATEIFAEEQKRRRKVTVALARQEARRCGSNQNVRGKDRGEANSSVQISEHLVQNIRTNDITRQTRVFAENMIVTVHRLPHIVHAFNLPTRRQYIYLGLTRNLNTLYMTISFLLARTKLEPLDCTAEKNIKEELT